MYFSAGHATFFSEESHVREADLYLEIIDPATGNVLPDGEWGEIVFTSLTRIGMPFLRYRTGDISRWKTGCCACGSKLKLLDYIQDRKLAKGQVNEYETNNKFIR